MSASIGQGKASEAVLGASGTSNLDYLARRAKVTKLGKGVSRKWGLSSSGII